MINFLITGSSGFVGTNLLSYFSSNDNINVVKLDLRVSADFIIEYIKDNEANISYKGSLITFIKKNKPELVYTLNHNEMFKIFIEEEYNEIVPINLYKELYNKL